jgi:hypothetical protein
MSANSSQAHSMGTPMMQILQMVAYKNLLKSAIISYISVISVPKKLQI